MNKKIVLIFTLFIAFTSFGQLKKITLEDGVLQQGRKFGADKLSGFQWIPNTNKYVYYAETFTKMMSASATDAKATELVTLADINSALGTKLKNFAGTAWIDTNTIMVSENGKYYNYSLTSKTGQGIKESGDRKSVV